MLSLSTGESQAGVLSGNTVASSGTTIRKNQTAPKRRSQRQMDKAEREEVSDGVLGTLRGAVACGVSVLSLRSDVLR